MLINRKRVGYFSPNLYLPLLPVLLMGLSVVTDSIVLCYFALLFVPYFVLVNPLGLLPVLLVSSLSSDYFAVAEGLGATRLFAIGFVLGTILSVLKTRNDEGKTVWLLPVLYIVLVTTVSSLINGGEPYLTILYRIFLSAFVAISCAFLRVTQRECERIIKSIVYAYVITTVFLVLNVMTNSNVISGRYSVSETVNSNRLAMMCVQLGVVMLMHMFISRRTIAIILGIVLCMACLVIIFLSGSRTGIIALILGSLLTSLIKRVVRKERFKNIIIILIVFLIGWLVLSYLIQNNDFLASRFTIESIKSSGGTHRYDALLVELKYIIPQHWLIGVGTSNEVAQVGRYMLVGYSSHNILFSMLTQIGVLGAVGYFCLIKRVFVKIVSGMKYNILFVFPLGMLVCALINGIGEIIYSERFFWCVLSFGILCNNSLKTPNDDGGE